MSEDYIVRRLTPCEAERLQGYPDGWTLIGEFVEYERHQEVDEDGNITEEWTEAIHQYIDQNGKKRRTTDSARYKALGNSINLPTWWDIVENICALSEHKTMASLFDGIGGFPLLWERAGGKAVWASEIEEFPIAVTKSHFPEEENESDN